MIEHGPTGNAPQKRPDRRRQRPAQANPPRQRAKRTDERRDTHQTRAHGGHTGTTEPKTETPDAQAKRPPTHKRPPQTPQQESSPGTRTDHATRTRNPGKPRLTDTPEEEASEADAARPSGHEKHRNSKKDSKTSTKQMVVGGKLLRGEELQTQKRPFEPDQRPRRPIRRGENEAWQR